MLLIPCLPYISQCRKTAPFPSLSDGWSPASCTAAPLSEPQGCVSVHSPGAETPRNPQELHCQSLDITSMGSTGACSHIKDEVGDPAVTQAPGTVEAAACHPSSCSSLHIGTASQALCQGYFPNGSSACSAHSPACLPAGWAGPGPSQPAEEVSWACRAGSLCTGGRASLVPSMRSPGAHCSPAGPRAFSGSPLRAEGGVGGCGEGIPGSQSFQIHTAVRAVLRKHPAERHGREVSQGFSCSQMQHFSDFGEQMSSCHWALLNLPDKMPYHLPLLSQSSKQLRGKKKRSNFAEEQHTLVCWSVAASVASPKTSMANLGFVCTYLLHARVRSSPDILFFPAFFLIFSTSLIIPFTFISAPSCTCPPGTGSFANHTANCMHRSVLNVPVARSPNEKN